MSALAELVPLNSLEFLAEAVFSLLEIVKVSLLACC